MKKYKVYLDVDYVMGHLRYGHYEGEVEANSEEEAKEYAYDNCCEFKFVVDDYEVDDIGDISDISVTEIE